MWHEVIQKILFVPIGNILSVAVLLFGLVPFFIADQDAIPNQNSALIFKCRHALFGFQRSPFADITVIVQWSLVPNLLAGSRLSNFVES